MSLVFTTDDLVFSESSTSVIAAAKNVKRTKHANRNNEKDTLFNFSVNYSMKTKKRLVCIPLVSTGGETDNWIAFTDRRVVLRLGYLMAL